MNLILITKLLCPLLAAFFAGYVPVYFLLEHKKGQKRIFNGEQKAGYSANCTKRDGRDTVYGRNGRGANSEDRCQTDRVTDFSALNRKAGFPGRHYISGQIFIFFVSIYLGFFIISNYLILLSLLKIKFGLLNAAIFGLIFFAAFVFIQIFKFKRAKHQEAKLQHYNAGNNRVNKSNSHQSEIDVSRDIEYVGSSTCLKLPIESARNKEVTKNITGNLAEDWGNQKENEESQKDYSENQKGGESSPKESKGNQKEDGGNLSERSKQEEKNQKNQTGKIGKISIAFQVIFAFFIFINFCVVTFFTFLFPIRFWDAISCWSLKGRAFFLDGNVTAVYSQHQYTFTHLTYPLYISLSQTWIYIWLGEINETLVKAIFPIFYLSLVFVVYYLLRKEVMRLYAIISVFILSTLPVIMDHGYLEYTNLIFSVILLLGVYCFYIYILKSRESYKNADRQNQNAHNQNRRAQTQIAQNQPAHGQATVKWVDKGQLARGQFVQKLITQKDDSIPRAPYDGQNIWCNIKNLIISAVFFAILVSIRSEGILFIVIFLAINTVYNLSALQGRLLRNNIGSIADAGSSVGKPGDAAAGICSLNDMDNPVYEGNPADGSQGYKNTKTPKSEIDINGHNDRRTICIKSTLSSKRRKIVLSALVSIILPAALILLLMAPWTILQEKLNISGASTEWDPVIEGLKNSFKNTLNGIVFVSGGLKEIFKVSAEGTLLVPGGLKNIFNGNTAAVGSSEISSLFDFKNAIGAFLGEFLFSKFDSARAFLGSSYGISWAILAVMAAFNLKKLFKSFNWIFFVFLSAGFIALFISLGFIAKFAWSTERYILHLFPLAYFWIMRSYLSNTISPSSFAPEK